MPPGSKAHLGGRGGEAKLCLLVCKIPLQALSGFMWTQRLIVSCCTECASWTVGMNKGNLLQ